MSEDEAKSWVATHFGLETVARLQIVADAVTEEATRQNLVASSTLQSIWSRHIVDSAQLLMLTGSLRGDDLWIDIGSGAGFPGLVIAVLTRAKVLLVEPRKRRAEFLATVVGTLGLEERVDVVCSKIENVDRIATIISARAVGYLGDILNWAAQCSNRETRWVLPKGSGALDEVASVAKTWHGTFHVEHSITDPNSLIVLASGVTRR